MIIFFERIKIVFILLLFSLLIISCSSVSKNEIKNEDNNKTQGEVSKKWGEVRLQYKMKTDLNNYGFNIYRGNSESGPFAKVNKDIIKISDTKNTNMDNRIDHTYFEYVDRPLLLNQTYYYYIDSVLYSGESKNISGINKVVVIKPLTMKQEEELGLEE